MDARNTKHGATDLRGLLAKRKTKEKKKRTKKSEGNLNLSFLTRREKLMGGGKGEQWSVKHLSCIPVSHISSREREHSQQGPEE